MYLLVPTDKYQEEIIYQHYVSIVFSSQTTPMAAAGRVVTSTHIQEVPLSGGGDAHIVIYNPIYIYSSIIW